VSDAVLRVCSTVLFIARRGRGAGWPEVGVRRRAPFQRRVRRLWRLAGMRGCALWSGHARAGEDRVCRHRLGNERERGRNFSVSSPGSGQG
jgi:hypothetical protein